MHHSYSVVRCHQDFLNSQPIFSATVDCDAVMKANLLAENQKQLDFEN